MHIDRRTKNVTQNLPLWQDATSFTRYRTGIFAAAATRRQPLQLFTIIHALTVLRNRHSLIKTCNSSSKTIENKETNSLIGVKHPIKHKQKSR